MLITPQQTNKVKKASNTSNTSTTSKIHKTTKTTLQNTAYQLTDNLSQIKQSSIQSPTQSPNSSDVHTRNHNVAYPVTDNFIKVGNFTYPVTHKFVVKESCVVDPEESLTQGKGIDETVADNPSAVMPKTQTPQTKKTLYPITHSFVIKEAPTFPIIEYYNRLPSFLTDSVISPWEHNLPPVEICFSINFPSRIIRGWRFQLLQWHERWQFQSLFGFSEVVVWWTSVGWETHMGSREQDVMLEFSPLGYESWRTVFDTINLPELPQPQTDDWDIDSLTMRVGVFGTAPHVGQSFPPWGIARPWSEFDDFRQPDPPNLGVSIGLFNRGTEAWMWNPESPPSIPIWEIPPHDFVCWVRGTRESREWNETASNMPIDDSLFYPGQGRPPHNIQNPPNASRRLSEQWFREPWKRYPYLIQ